MRWNLKDVGGKPPARPTGTTYEASGSWISLQDKAKFMLLKAAASPSGGTMLFGIPTVMDRLIQQALLQVLTPIFDTEFSTFSHG